MRYDRSMRYGQRGGYMPAEQERRERVRLQAAEWFETGEPTRTIAARLRVRERSVTRWRKAWQEGGTSALLSPDAHERQAGRPAWAQGSAGQALPTRHRTDPWGTDAEEPSHASRLMTQTPVSMTLRPLFRHPLARVLAKGPRDHREGPLAWSRLRDSNPRPLHYERSGKPWSVPDAAAQPCDALRNDQAT